MNKPPIKKMVSVSQSTFTIYGGFVYVYLAAI